jgi:heptosyltransferase-2
MNLQPAPGKRGKMLVIRGGAIGDFILTLPAISALRETFPETHLEILGYPRVTELAHAAGLVDAFRSIEARPLARFFARNAELDPNWSAYFESFHLVISYLYDPDEIFKSNMGRCTKAQFIQARHRPDESEDLHATSVFLKPLEQLAIFDPDPVPRLAASTFPRSETLTPGPWIAVHPGSGSEKKNWPEQNWLQLLQTLRGRKILLVGGEAEADRLTRFRDNLARALPPSDSAREIRLAQNLPLPHLAGLLAQTQHFIGHDSGITHLAAALGLPTLSLWGPSRPQIWKPLGPKIQLLHSPENTLQNLDLPTVAAALHNLLNSPH